jgi:hypothetical protein
MKTFCFLLLAAEIHAIHTKIVIVQTYELTHNNIITEVFLIYSVQVRAILTQFLVYNAHVWVIIT